MILRVAAQQNVGSAAGHVGGNRDRAFASRLRDDEGFALVILGVQDLVPARPFFFRMPDSFSDFSTETVPTSTGWPLFVAAP